MTVSQVALAAAAITSLWYLARRHYFERAVARRLPPGPDGMVSGAQPVSLGSGGRGVLLLHGFGDTPQSLRALAHHLHGAGWTVRVPLLPGHGRSLRALANSSAQEWEREARLALADLHAECAEVSLAGQSMGGALATMLAADTPGVSSLVLLAPYFRMDPAPALVGRLHWFTAPFIPYLRSRNEGSIRDAEARGVALGAGITSPRLLHELHRLVRRARECLPAVTAPTLVIHSRHDPRIGAQDAEQAFALLRTTSRRLHWLDHSAHVISVDHDRDAVFALVAEWIGRGPDGHRSQG